MKKVMFIASIGGHLSELLELKALFNKYDSVLVTEKHSIRINVECNKEFLPRIKKRNYFLLSIIFFKSIIYFLKYNPDYIITTGAAVCVPMCYIAKIFNRKVIFIESIARVSSKSLTGKLLEKITDYIIVQWPEMLNIYKGSVYLGPIL